MPRFLYATNPGDCSVDQFTIDKTSGGITQVNKPVTAGTPSMYAWSLALDPAQKFLFFSSLDMPGAPGGGPWTWADGNVTSWSIDPTTGALTLVSTYSQTTGPAIGIVPSGKFLIVADTNHDLLTTLSVDGKGGLGLASSTNMASGSQPYGLAIDSKGAFVYVTNLGTSTISVYSIGSAGALTAVGSPVAAGKGVRGPSITPDGKFLVVANCNDGTISTFSIASSGAITAVANSAVKTGNQPVSTTVHPSGKFVYGANYDNITSYTNSATWAITLDPATGLLSNPTPSYGILNNVVAVDPTGSFVYSGIFKDIDCFSANQTTGALTTAGRFGNIQTTLTGSYNEPIVSFVFVK